MSRPPFRALLAPVVCALLIALATTAWAAPAPAPASAPAPAPSAELRLQPPIPPRADDAPSGDEFLRRIADLDAVARENAILEQALAGNVPAFARSLRPVRLRWSSPRGETHEATVWVMPDYLAIGSNEDFVRVPVGLPTAERIAQEWGMGLPTRRIVDATYRQAELKLRPEPMPPGPEMTSTRYFVEHDRSIERQRGGRAIGRLVAGHKKDLVTTPRLDRQPGRVAIYGWHRDDGRPIQPLSLVHGARYADYSHGVRLVSLRVLVDGSWHDLRELLHDPELAPLVSDEGSFGAPAVPVVSAAR